MRPNPQNEREHSPIQTRILNEIWDLEKLGQLNPQDNINSRTQILSNFDWTSSTLELEANQVVETLLVDFHDILVRHRFDTGVNTECKVQLIPWTTGSLIPKAFQHQSTSKTTS